MRKINKGNEQKKKKKSNAKRESINEQISNLCNFIEKSKRNSKNQARNSLILSYSKNTEENKVPKREISNNMVLSEKNKEKNIVKPQKSLQLEEID